MDNNITKFMIRNKERLVGEVFCNLHFVEHWDGIEVSEERALNLVPQYNSPDLNLGCGINYRLITLFVVGSCSTVRLGV